MASLPKDDELEKKMNEGMTFFGCPGGDESYWGIRL